MKKWHKTLLILSLICVILYAFHSFQSVFKEGSQTLFNIEKEKFYKIEDTHNLPIQEKVQLKTIFKKSHEKKETTKISSSVKETINTRNNSTLSKKAKTARTIKMIESSAKKYLVGDKWRVINLNRSGIPPKVYVYEEHQEVIEAWLKLDGRHPYTLLHIDAHSDDAPINLHTLITKKYVKPKTNDEIKRFVQSNDEFITGSVYMGLVNDVIILEPRFNNLSLDIKISQGIGELKSDSRTSCLCAGKSKSCMTEGSSGRNSIKRIPRKDCLIKYNYNQSDIFLDHLLSDTLRKVLINKSKSFILDIDEDFFGVSLVTKRLIKSLGMKLKDVEKFTGIFGFLFCPWSNYADKSPHRTEELAVNSWYKNFLTEFLRICKPALSRFSNCPIRIPRQLHRKLIYQIFNSYPNLECKMKSNSPSKIEVLDVIWRHLRNMTVDQLKELRSIGMCRSTSHRTFASNWTYTPCLGSNYYGDSAVEEYSHTSDGIEKQINLLNAVLARLPSPEIITVCRSSRDGYVPRDQQPIIEKKILRTIQSVFGSKQSDIIFDPYLAGGKNGWINSA